jgi:hypothetical protein
MTNKEIKKCKQRLAAIVAKFNELPVGSETIEQKLKKLDSIVDEIHKLVMDIGAPRLLGKENRDLRQMLMEAFEKKSDRDKLAAVEEICKLYYQDILYALQTEMMFNACVFAKWSCFLAAVAAIVACVSIIVMLFSK